MTPTKRVVNSGTDSMLSYDVLTEFRNAAVFNIFKKSPVEDTAHRLYVTIVTQARRPIFYNDFAVPDTTDGRFDMVVLHAYLLFHRMKRDQETTGDLSQAVFDLMFADMDQNLREMGVGDIGVSHRIKGMIKAFYGRLDAYDRGLLDPSDGQLVKALRRNLYRKSEPEDLLVGCMAQYIRSEITGLAAQDTQQIQRGEITFGSPVLPPRIGK